MLADGVDEEVIAVIRAVAVERLLHTHFADRLVHRFDDGGCQRAGDVADAQTDDVRIGMRGAVRLHAASDFRKQVRPRQTGKIIVDMKHSYLPFYILYRDMPRVLLPQPLAVKDELCCSFLIDVTVVG